MKKFKSLSFILKPSNLRNVIAPFTNSTMNQQFPTIIIENNLPIIRNFTKIYDDLDFVYIKPFNNKNNYVISDNNIPKISLILNNNSDFYIEDRNKLKYNTIAIKNNQNMFLTTSEDSCFPLFKRKESNSNKDFINNTSFYKIPIKSI